jgi:tetratricopeptide (TPR) repeat protein
MDSGKDINEAEKLALKGLGLKPDLRTNILAHFVLADIYNRLGRYEKSRQHVDKAKQLQKN